MRKLLFLAPIVAMAVYMAVVSSAIAAEGDGNIVIVEQAACSQSPCETFFFHGAPSTVGDFTLNAVRANRTNDSASFSVSPGIYTVTQMADSAMPLTGITCTSDQRRLTLNKSATGVAIELRAGESITCVFANSAPTPTPTPTATATATPTPTATATPVPPTVVPPTPVPPIVIIQQVQPTAVPATPVATQPVIIPPRTGDAGLRK